MDLIVRQGEREEKVALERHDDGKYKVTVADQTFVIDVATAGEIVSLGVDDGRQFEVAVCRLNGPGHHKYRVSSVRGVDEVEVMDPLTHMLEQAMPEKAGGGKVAALMPGRVVEVLLAEGADVAKGQGVVVVEAMKMKNEIQAETAGKVAKIYVEAGQNVEGGDPLFEIE